MGYLFFRIARGRAAIVHLCISPIERGKGLARELVDKLKQMTAQLECITLRCRRDFAANLIWPRFGFLPRGQVKGRGSDGAELTVWHFDHGHADLFSTVNSEKTKVAIDTNIFLDLSLPNRTHHQASMGLTDAWLDEIIELVVTPEIFNDINRCADKQIGTQSRAKLTGYQTLRASENAVNALTAKLSTKYPNLVKTEQGISDIKHLAYSISAGVKYFVTRDEMVLGLAVEILQAFDLQLLTLIELIGRHDEIERESEYQPRRLMATQLAKGRMRAEQVDDIIEAFRHAPLEKIHEFRYAVNSLLSMPRAALVQLTQNEQGHPLVLVGKNTNGYRLEVSLLRMTSHALAPTVLRHTLMELIREASADCMTVIAVTDRFQLNELLRLA